MVTKSNTPIIKGWCFPVWNPTNIHSGVGGIPPYYLRTAGTISPLCVNTHRAGRYVASTHKLKNSF